MSSVLPSAAAVARQASRPLPLGRAATTSACARARGQRRSLSTAASLSSPLDVAALRADLASRPAKATYDVLSPTHSHLLNVCLSDYLPRGAAAVEFDRSAPDAFQLPSAASPAGLLPAGHHLVYFPLQAPPSLLLPDGTDPAQSPGAPFVRRMWAGGSVRFHAPQDLRLDNRRVVCVERLGPEPKVTGASGREKIFVDVWRRYGPVPDFGGVEVDADVAPQLQAGVEAAVEAGPAVEERRTLVFMREDEAAGKAEAAQREPKIVKAPFPPDDAFTVTPPQSLLFHFSALTFNAHAIHLDPEYCRRVEGHRGLLVHGPLSLVLMLAAVRRQVAQAAGDDSAIAAAAAIRNIEYRNLAPLYAGEPLRVCIRRNPNSNGNGSDGDEAKWDVWVEGPQGGLAVRGVAVTKGV